MNRPNGFSKTLVCCLLISSAAILIAALSLPVQAAGGLYSSATTLTEPKPAASDKFGSAYNSATMLSTDGQTAMVAAMDATVGTATQAGKVYIYHFSNGKWVQTAELDDPDDTTNDQFGGDIAINADGTVALIGSNATVNGHAHAGKAYLYALLNGTWTKTHEFDDPADAANDSFGYTGTALSASGQSAVFGADATTVNSQTSAGEAYIYTEFNGSWTQAAAIPDPDDVTNDYFADVVAISGDGLSVLIGSGAAVNGNTFAGKAYLYTFTSGQWVKSMEFDDPLAAANDAFGYNDVALSSDGKTAVISACGTTLNGNATAGEGYIFNDLNGVWTKTAAIPDPDNAANDCFSFPAAVSANGSVALFGSEAALNGQAFAGKAYLYTLSNGSWVKAKEFDDPAATANDVFGEGGVALAGDGESALMGAPGTTVNSLASAGEAYLYQSPDDLSVALSANPASVTKGQTVGLDATVTNTDSAVTANEVALTNTLPAGFTYLSSNAAGGACSASGATVTCFLTSLAPGAVWQPTITAAAGSAGTDSDSVTVTSYEPDPNSANDSATAKVTVSAPPTSGSSGGGGGALGFLSLLMLSLPLLGRQRRK